MALTTNDCDIYDLIHFAESWNGLGWAVQEQVVKVLADSSCSANPAAIHAAYDELHGYNEDFEELLYWLQDKHPGFRRLV